MAVRRRLGAPARGFRIPTVVAVVGALSSLGLMAFVPLQSVTVAAVVVLLGLVLVGSMRRLGRDLESRSL